MTSEQNYPYPLETTFKTPESEVVVLRQQVAALESRLKAAEEDAEAAFDAALHVVLPKVAVLAPALQQELAYQIRTQYRIERAAHEARKQQVTTPSAEGSS